MTEATIGHNNPPSPIDEAKAPFANQLSAAENWCDGAKVENDGQESVVDALIKDIKACKKAVEAADESATKPMYDAWKAKKAEFKPSLDDLDRIVKALVATVDPYKRAKAAAKEEAARKVRQEAERAAEAARQAHAATDPANLEAARAAEAAIEAAAKLAMDAKRAEQDGVKGMRTYTVVTVLDAKLLAGHIWTTDRAAMDAFLQDYAEKHQSAPGVAVTKEKRAV